MRIFIAILFSPAVKNKISNIIDSIREEGYHGRETAKENLHMTLHYLGETKQEKILDIVNELQKILFKSFKIHTSSLDTFGKEKRKKILYLGIKRSRKLMALQNDVIKKLNKVGYHIDQKNFTPHITLMKRLEIDEAKIEDFSIDSFQISVDSISLMESKRVEGELIYQEIINIPLKK